MPGDATHDPHPPAGCDHRRRPRRPVRRPARPPSRGATVTLVTKGSLRASNSFMAQGGIASGDRAGRLTRSALRPTPSRAGRGLCDPGRGATCSSSEGVDRIARPGAAGGESSIARRTAATSWAARAVTAANRILHAGGSATGAAIAEHADRRGRGTSRASTVLEHAAAIDLICRRRRLRRRLGAAPRRAAGRPRAA